MKYAVLILILLSQISFGQNNGVGSDSLKKRNKETITDFGFGRLTSNSALPPTVITQLEFNHGNIHDPLQLIQGKVSGLLITKPGNDPNEPFSARIRGINSVYLSSSPLIIVDGMPYSSLLNVDPLDISKITIVKDAATASQFGINSQSGVILIDTHTGENNRLSIRQYVALEVPDIKPEVALSSTDYINLGGVDLGNRINWQEEITQNALSSVTHISYGDKKGKTEYYASFNYRNANGVLENSGFKNYNGRAKITQGFFGDRLRLSGNFSLTQRKNNFSFPEAYKYTNAFNPTAPVAYSNGTGYFEYIVFDSYNPEAMIHQNINDGTTKISRAGVNLSYKIFRTLQVSAGFSSESQKNDVRRYWSKDAWWMGERYNGYRKQDTQNLTTNVGFASATFSKNINKTFIDLTASVSGQNLDFNEHLFSASNFETDEEGQASVIDSSHWEPGYIYAKNHGITSYRASFSTTTTDQLFMNMNLSHEQYSDNIKGTTFGIAVGFDFMAKNNKALQSLKPKVSVGKSSGSLSFFQNYNPRNIVQGWRSLYPDKVKPEHKTEFTVGVDWKLSSVGGSANFFNASTKDVVARHYDDVAKIYRIVNSDGIRNSGIEIDLHWDVLNKEDFQLRTGLNFSSIKNTYLTDQGTVEYPPLEFILFMGASNFYSLQNNRPIGQFIGFNYNGIVNNYWNMKDYDGNGSWSPADHITYGKPLPVCFLGWTTSVKAGRWSAALLFRGAFGHSLYNATRNSYENPDLIQSYNATASVASGPLKTIAYPNLASDFYLEDASYFTLDNLGISYELFRTTNYNFSCDVNFTVQNLFTLTNYSGTSPEVRFDYNGAQYAAGYDSQFTYSSSRTFLIGINFRL